MESGAAASTGASTILASGILVSGAASDVISVSSPHPIAPIATNPHAAIEASMLRTSALRIATSWFEQKLQAEWLCCCFRAAHYHCELPQAHVAAYDQINERAPLYRTTIRL